MNHGFEDIIMKGAMDFQKATARHIFNILTDPSRSHRRVLLADEVGLGKTIVARNVVSLMREYQREELHDDFYRVVYVCSNINIARQNVDKLGVNDSLDFNESRLSMQHLSIAKKDAEIKSALTENGQMPEIIIPLTPSTSFDFRSSTGIAGERALICVLLEELEEFSDKDARRYLEKFFQCTVSRIENWKWYLDKYRRETYNLGEEYRLEIKDGLRRLGSEQLARLKQWLQDAVAPEWTEKASLISSIRRIFAEISLDKLQPDLVIMDEFQRFKNLLVGENEQSLLSKKFFSDPNTKVLLLSATPYKPFTTLDELTESGSDESFSDFRQVMGFLQEGNIEQKESFDDAWKRFNVALTHISKDTYDVVKIAKEGAEDALYGMMCRTERFNTGGVKTRRVKIEVAPEDIGSYFEARKILDEINGVSSEAGFRTIPIDYVKSSPYLMSFMDRYKLKGFVRANRKKIEKRAWDLLYLPLNKVDGYRNVPAGNARLQFLWNDLFSNGYSAEKLLWVPASRPYYQTHGVYAKNSGYSKTLLFSSWEMVPRMVSCMVSYEAERRVVRGLIADGKRPGGYFKAENKKSKARYGANRLSKYKEGENPLCFVCKFLAGLYNPADYIGEDISSIRRTLTPLVQEKVSGIASKYGLPIEGRVSVGELTPLMRLLDEEIIEVLPEKIAMDAVENLVSVAIASPAICAYRLHHDKEEAIQIAEFFEKLFNRADSAMVIDLCKSKDGDNYVEDILEYCVEGNLQAVLDEFDHLLEGKWDTILEQGPIDVGTLMVEFQQQDKELLSRPMRTYMAIPFTNARMDEKVVAHTSVLRNAFNSPFRPFVLSTTSVGQEGLDFHWYARKLLHWNLPSNPVDMEQREGRVNRYKCLSVRQRLGERYADVPSWDGIFEAARKEFKRNDSDMVPFWCLPPDFPDDKSKLVERIILEYPLSQDKERYDRLKKILSLYRLTMGQPRQEELLEMLASSGLTEELIDKLLINLSPYYRNK